MLLYVHDDIRTVRDSFITTERYSYRHFADRIIPLRVPNARITRDRRVNVELLEGRDRGSKPLLICNENRIYGTRTKDAS